MLIADQFVEADGNIIGVDNLNVDARIADDPSCAGSGPDPERGRLGVCWMFAEKQPAPLT